VPGTDWRPTATWEVLAKRAELLAQIRSFFARAGVLEVETPQLGNFAVTDLHIDCVAATVNGATRYLQSSPEYFMKRLLAAGAGPIYSLGKVFRDEECGRRHRPEFTLLEWYRPGWDEHLLMDEVARLIAGLSPQPLAVSVRPYGEVFAEITGLDPHRADTADLASCAARHCGGDWRSEPRATLLDLLFSQVVEPRLPDGLLLLCDYPACQAALARLGKNPAGEPVARRFELFLNRMELGNGYFELADADEQRRRFAADMAAREGAGKRPMAADERLLAALRHGLPDCAGVAIGVDRLLMQLVGAGDIAEVLAFGDG